MVPPSLPGDRHNQLPGHSPATVIAAPGVTGGEPGQAYWGVGIRDWRLEIRFHTSSVASSGRIFGARFVSGSHPPGLAEAKRGAYSFPSSLLRGIMP